jgi:hypothetical protein
MVAPEYGLKVDPEVNRKVETMMGAAPVTAAESVSKVDPD